MKLYNLFEQIVLYFIVLTISREKEKYPARYG
jgi:hypothetical protein